MKKIQTLLLTATTAATLLSTAFSTAYAQSGNLGNNITTQYNIDDLGNRPALVNLGKGDMLILDFPANISAILTPQNQMLDIPEPLSNIAVITGKTSTGTAQVMVQLENGKTAEFVITLTPGGNGMKRLKISNTAPLNYAQPVITNTTQTQTVMPTYRAPQNAAPLAVVPSRSVTNVLPQGQNALKVPVPLNTISSPAPSWLNMNVNSEGQNINITLKNTGSRPVAFAANNLKLLVGNTLVDSNLTEDVSLAAGSTRTVPLTLTQPVTEPLKVIWAAYDAAANANYTFIQ